MRKIRCGLGFHRNKILGTQTVHGIIDGFSMTPPMRDVNKCEDCGKITFFYYDVSYSRKDNLFLDWQPKNFE